jgi:hypothetical protein
MAEFKWSKEFLKANGIDFVALKKLYYSVVWELRPDSEFINHTKTLLKLWKQEKF